MKQALALAFLIAPSLIPVAAHASPSLDGEKQLARLLEGREAGAPVHCILRIGNRKVIDQTAITYRIGKTIYVNRTSNPSGLDSKDSFLSQSTNAYSSKLCQGDVVKNFDDRGGILWTDLGRFEEFVPYTRLGTTSAE